MKAIHLLYTTTFLLLISLISCNKIPVGYLETENAAFEPNTVYAYREIDPDSERAKNNAPWTSLRIQGVAGTVPINYEFYGIKAENGGNADLFRQAIQDGDVLVQGGIIQLFQSGVKKLPNGSYIISLKVYNEGHSRILKDVFTFIIKDKEEEEE